MDGLGGYVGGGGREWGRAALKINCQRRSGWRGMGQEMGDLTSAGCQWCGFYKSQLQGGGELVAARVENNWRKILEDLRAKSGGFHGRFWQN